MLFAECVNLCNENMRQDWGNPKLQLIWSVRDRTGTNFALIVRGWGGEMDATARAPTSRSS